MWIICFLKDEPKHFLITITHDFLCYPSKILYFKIIIYSSETAKHHWDLVSLGMLHTNQQVLEILLDISRQISLKVLHLFALKFQSGLTLTHLVWNYKKPSLIHVIASKLQYLLNMRVKCSLQFCAFWPKHVRQIYLCAFLKLQLYYVYRHHRIRLFEWLYANDELPLQSTLYDT